MNKDHEMYILDRMIYALKMYDIVLSYDSNGILVAEDDYGNKWFGKDFYVFLTEECLSFEPDGTLSEGCYVREGLLASYKELSIENGVIPGKPE